MVKKLFFVRRIVGGSMLPALTPGRLVLALRPKRLNIGDVVILFHDGLEKIKRIEHLEGERVYVLGDNSEASTDSRQFGFIDRNQIMGRVVWPRV